MLPNDYCIQTAILSDEPSESRFILESLAQCSCLANSIHFVTLVSNRIPILLASYYADI